jgi:type II secretory pathway pseudopilin PulG
LIEVAVVTIIAGILAAMATPSMVGMKARNDLRDAMGQVKGAIQEAQRAAIKQGRSCAIVLTSTSVTALPIGCITNPVSFSTGITLQENFSNTTDCNSDGTNEDICFSFKGNTTDGGSIVLQSTNTSEQKCLSMSPGLGIMRTGSYTGTPFSGTCTTEL